MTSGKSTLRVRAGFTLVEMLVVIGIVMLLAGLMIPAVLSGLDKAKNTQCLNNLRQLYLANTMYSHEKGHYVAAASDICYPPGSNNRRWHGVRKSSSEPFAAAAGPLVPYLGESKMVRMCPSFLSYVEKTGWGVAFEASCGGYGYNMVGVGSQAYMAGFNAQGVARGMNPDAIRNPEHTVMFCDTAFPQPYGNPTYLVEYSFAEPYHHLSESAPPGEYGQAVPSVHFRHRGHANVIWCDGHVSGEKMETEYSAPYTRLGVGWFGPPDNSLFDPK